MRLWLLSDLHVDSDSFVLPLPRESADVLIVAGDILSPLSEGIRWLRANTALPVVCVAGNADFHGTDISTERALSRQLAKEAGIHLLEEEAIVLGKTGRSQGIRFVGATLWTDYQLDGDAARGMNEASLAIMDHRLICFRDSFFTPVAAASAHRRARIWLEGVLSEPFEGRTVVITHHAPSPFSISPEHRGNPLNAAFASDLHGLIIRHRPDLWIHGHVHASQDYRVGRTRIVCNPRGNRVENEHFDPGLVVCLGA